MEREEATLFIPYSILKNEHISSYALMTYCYLQKLTTTTGDNVHYVSAYSIASYLTGDVEHSRKLLENVRHAIYDLLEINVISIAKEIKQSNGYYAIDCSRLWINTEKEQFVIIYYDEVLKIIRSQLKSTKEAIVHFEKGGRQDLINQSNFEIDILESYLPKQLSNEEIEKIIKDKINELSLDVKNIGLIMKNVMPILNGKTDGNKVRTIVQKISNE